MLVAWTAGTVGVAHAEGPAFDATGLYKEESVEGFTVLLHPEVLKRSDEAKAVRKELESQLKAIRRAVPEKPLEALTKVRIWVEWERKKGGAAEFHPSKGWLKANGYNPEKAGCVELNNARNFVRWSRADQPWMVMHELAHAYHFLVLGERHEGVADAFKQATDQKLYESVKHVRGDKRMAYALTNAKEYFAELTEAYFGRNDFYPFTRAELKAHDPAGYRLMEQTWGTLRHSGRQDD
jgi:predicted metallopeptidase